jgi:hypothetical protein
MQIHYVSICDREIPLESVYTATYSLENVTLTDVFHRFTLSMKPDSRKEILQLPSLSSHVIHISSNNFAICEFFQ